MDDEPSITENITREEEPTVVDGDPISDRTQDDTSASEQPEEIDARSETEEEGADHDDAHLDTSGEDVIEDHAEENESALETEDDPEPANHDIEEHGETSIISSSEADKFEEDGSQPRFADVDHRDSEVESDAEENHEPSDILDESIDHDEAADEHEPEQSMVSDDAHLEDEPLQADEPAISGMNISKRDTRRVGPFCDI